MNLPLEEYKRVSPDLTTTRGAWTPELLNSIIDQFDVERTPRYQRRVIEGKNATFCNILVWDVTQALGVEVPYIYDSSGVPGEVGQPGMLEHVATDMLGWLQTYGPAQGWIEVDGRAAQDAANKGWPAVASQPGHMSMIRPEGCTSYSDRLGPVIAQAGASNSNCSHVWSKFDSNRGIHYFINSPDVAAAGAGSDSSTTLGLAALILIGVLVYTNSQGAPARKTK